MVNSILNLKINNEQSRIDINQIPVISKKSQKLFEKAVALPEDCSYDVKGRCQDFKKSLSTLEAAKNTSIRDKFVAFLATTVSVGVVAGTVLGAMAVSGGLAAVVGIGGFLVFSALNGLYNYAYASDKNGVIPFNAATSHGSFIALTFVGPFIPLYKAFTKISGLTQESTQLKANLEKNMTELTRYYEDNYEDLQEALQKDLEAAEESLETVENLKTKTPEGERQLKALITDLKKAQEELEVAHNFYNNFIK